MLRLCCLIERIISISRLQNDVYRSLSNPKTIDVNLKSITPGITMAKTSVPEIEIVERKINLATEGFTRRFCEGLL
jgi:hypothetical protein